MCGWMAPAAITLKATQGFSTFSMKAAVSSGLLHHMLSLLRVVVRRVAPHPVVFFAVLLGRGRPVAVHVEGLDVEVGVDLVLLARDGHVQRVAADAGRHALGLDQLDHLRDGVDLAAVHA